MVFPGVLCFFFFKVAVMTTGFFSPPLSTQAVLPRASDSFDLHFLIENKGVRRTRAEFYLPHVREALCSLIRPPDAQTDFKIFPNTSPRMLCLVFPATSCCTSVGHYLSHETSSCTPADRELHRAQRTNPNCLRYRWLLTVFLSVKED